MVYSVLGGNLKLSSQDESVIMKNFEVFFSEKLDEIDSAKIEKILAKANIELKYQFVS